jgi:hypothetical protein
MSGACACRPSVAAPWVSERPGARWPGAGTLVGAGEHRRGSASGSADADKPAHGFRRGSPDRHPSARTRRGASYSDDTGGAAAPHVMRAWEHRRPTRWGAGGAPEHRPTVSLLVANEVRRTAAVSTEGERCGVLPRVTSKLSPSQCGTDGNRAPTAVVCGCRPRLLSGRTRCTGIGARSISRRCVPPAPRPLSSTRRRAARSASRRPDRRAPRPGHLRGAD